MGQKVHPIGFRLGVIKTWDSRWYAKKNYAALLHEDIKIRSEVKKRLSSAGVSKIEIERAGQKAKINIHTARPGIIIGKKGAEVDKLKNDHEAMTGTRPSPWSGSIWTSTTIRVTLHSRPRSCGKASGEKRGHHPAH